MPSVARPPSRSSSGVSTGSTERRVQQQADGAPMAPMTYTSEHRLLQILPGYVSHLKPSLAAAVTQELLKEADLVLKDLPNLPGRVSTIILRLLLGPDHKPSADGNTDSDDQVQGILRPHSYDSPSRKATTQQRAPNAQSASGAATTTPMPPLPPTHYQNVPLRSWLPAQTQPAASTSTSSTAVRPSPFSLASAIKARTASTHQQKVDPGGGSSNKDTGDELVFTRHIHPSAAVPHRQMPLTAPSVLYNPGRQPLTTPAPAQRLPISAPSLSSNTVYVPARPAAAPAAPLPRAPLLAAHVEAQRAGVLAAAARSLPAASSADIHVMLHSHGMLSSASSIASHQSSQAMLNSTGTLTSQSMLNSAGTTTTQDSLGSSRLLSAIPLTLASAIERGNKPGSGEGGAAAAAGVGRQPGNRHTPTGTEHASDTLTPLSTSSSLSGGGESPAGSSRAAGRPPTAPDVPPPARSVLRVPQLPSLPPPLDPSLYSPTYSDPQSLASPETSPSNRDLSSAGSSAVEHSISPGSIDDAVKAVVGLQPAINFVPGPSLSQRPSPTGPRPSCDSASTSSRASLGSTMHASASSYHPQYGYSKTDAGVGPPSASGGPPGENPATLLLQRELSGDIAVWADHSSCLPFSHDSAHHPQHATRDSPPFRPGHVYTRGVHPRNVLVLAVGSPAYPHTQRQQVEGLLGQRSVSEGGLDDGEFSSYRWSSLPSSALTTVPLQTVTLEQLLRPVKYLQDQSVQVGGPYADMPDDLWDEVDVRDVSSDVSDVDSNPEEDVSKAVQQLVKRQFPSIATALYATLKSTCTEAEMLRVAAATKKAQAKGLAALAEEALERMMGEFLELKARVQELEACVPTKAHIAHPGSASAPTSGSLQQKGSTSSWNHAKRAAMQLAMGVSHGGSAVSSSSSAAGGSMQAPIPLGLLLSNKLEGTEQLNSARSSEAGTELTFAQRSIANSSCGDRPSSATTFSDVVTVVASEPNSADFTRVGSMISSPSGSGSAGMSSGERHVWRGPRRHSTREHHAAELPPVVPPHLGGLSVPPGPRTLTLSGQSQESGTGSVEGVAVTEGIAGAPGAGAAASAVVLGLPVSRSSPQLPRPTSRDRSTQTMPGSDDEDDEEESVDPGPGPEPALELPPTAYEPAQEAVLENRQEPASEPATSAKSTSTQPRTPPKKRQPTCCRMQ